MKIISKIASIMMLFILVSSCKKEEHKYHNLMDKIEAESLNYEDPNISSERYNEVLEKVLIKNGESEFYVPSRKIAITSYQCSECHNQPINDLKNAQEGKRAHWDVELVHAKKEIMNCTTCHADNNMNELRSLTDESIDFNQSHNLCSQCHQKQGKDWLGGAHGKKLGGWASPRVSQTCTGCHNPHSPSFETRWPAQFNTQKVKERQ